MGNNDNQYDDGAAIKGASEAEYMTNGNDLLEYEESNYEELREAYCEEYEPQFNEYLERIGCTYDRGQASEEHDEFFGGEGWMLNGVVLERSDIDQLKAEFILDDEDRYGRFVENEYNNRGND